MCSPEPEPALTGDDSELSRRLRADECSHNAPCCSLSVIFRTEPSHVVGPAPLATSRLDSPSVRASFRPCCPSFDLDHRFAGVELLRYLSAHRHARDNAIQHSSRYTKHSILALAATSLTVADYDDAGFVSKKPTDGMTVNA